MHTISPLQYQTLQLGGRLGPVTEKLIQFAFSAAALISLNILFSLKLLKKFLSQVQSLIFILVILVCDVQTSQSVNFGYVCIILRVLQLTRGW